MNPNGREVRSRSAENVLSEIQYVVETFKPETIYFGDEIFTVQKDRAMAICQGLIDQGLHKKISWWSQTHVRCIDEELAQTMKLSNCSLMGLGIESGDEEKLKQMGKGTRFKDINRAVEIIKKPGFLFKPFLCWASPMKRSNRR
tara:strand:- start:192 stop:623 length:432 start_codon:yes stop_codon:yes gene_type:complete